MISSQTCGFLFMNLTDADIARFWKKVVKNGPDKCWGWRGGVADFGYGRFRIFGTHKTAHRISYVLEFGEIKHGLWVLHRCDNPPCCNPAHLFLGTQQDNSDDMVSKGRSASGNRHGSVTHPERIARGDRNGLRLHPERVCRGDNHPSSKVSSLNVLEIRRLRGEGKTLLGIGKLFGIGKSHVLRIVNREVWRNI